MSTLLRLEEATLGYPTTVVLQNFDWAIQRGERWAITGPNGAGKSTLMKTILGLIPLLGGRMTYFAPSGNPIDRPRIGYLPQINQIDRAFPISAGEVVDSGLDSCGLRHKPCRHRVAELLEAVGLKDMERTPIGELSGGQLQRILLARALAPRPELLVLDEPTSFLDKAYKQQFDTLLERLSPEDATILMVTHDYSADTLQGWQTLSVGRW